MLIGNKYSLNVYLGKQVIAEILLSDDQLHWHYKSTWQNSGYAISPHLPLYGEIPMINVQRFLRNLLPEGNGLDELLSTFHLSKYNTFGLIKTLGLDTPGSLIMLPPQAILPKEGLFRPISNDELEQRLETRDEFSLIIWDGKPRLSVAGVQDKINVVINSDGQIGFGEGSLCSTHILKFEKQKLSHLVLNEYISMQLAKEIGLSVADVEFMRFGKHTALLIKRFDRHYISTNEVKRRHLIDGCQALNLSPEYKYEQNFGNSRDVAHIRDGASFKKLFDFTSECINPALTKQHLVDWMIFNILIYNYDAHGKNVSFYVGKEGIQIAPFYDLVNIKMYPEFEQHMAMALGDEFDANAVNAYQLADFSDSCQLPRSWLTNRIKFILKKFKKCLNSDVWRLACNDEEQKYLINYKSMIYLQYEHLLKEVDYITKTTL